MPLLCLSPLMSVKLKHTWRKPGSPLLYFRRRIPDAVRPLLAVSGSPHAGKAHVVVSLQTSDPRVAAPRIAKLVRQTDEEWSALLRPTEQTRTGISELAYRLLTDNGIDPLDPKATPEALDAFYNFIEDRLPVSVTQDEDITHGHQLDPHLSPIHREALRLVEGRKEFTLTDCLDQYVKARPNAEKTARIAFGYLKGFLGSDRDIRKVRRPDVNGFVAWLLAGGHSPKGQGISAATVDRYLNIVKAAWDRAIRENELKIENVFARVEVPKTGKEATERLPFTADQLKALHQGIDAWVAAKGWDQLRCILTVLAETGCRLAEVAGLAAADVHLHAAVPHIDLKPHPWRSLKNAPSARKVPLTPRAAQALKEAHRLAGGSPFAFPTYTTAEGCRANSVSAVLNKWLGGRDGLKGSGLTNHCLRHTMKDRLRAVQCPQDIQNQILGHLTPGVGATYGTGYPLMALAEWITRATA
jgi:integrase